MEFTMSISVIAICNRALDLLAVDPITSLEDDSKAARLCNRNYAPCRDSILRAYPWNSALRRVLLPALSETPAFGAAYAYALPEGPEPLRCLRVLEVDDAEVWKVEGRKILTDCAAPLAISYIGQIEDPADFDPLLSEAIAAKLAVYLSANLTESGARLQAVQEYLGDILAMAKSADAQEGSAGALVADQWLQSRI